MDREDRIGLSVSVPMGTTARFENVGCPKTLGMCGERSWLLLILPEGFDVFVGIFHSEIVLSVDIEIHPYEVIVYFFQHVLPGCLRYRGVVLSVMQLRFNRGNNCQFADFKIT